MRFGDEIGGERINLFQRQGYDIYFILALKLHFRLFSAPRSQVSAVEEGNEDF